MSAATQDASAVKLSVKEKIAYSFTDMAGNLLYVTISSYIMYFYTNVFHIPAAGALGAGTILLVARFADAISAVVWGSIVDHTNTKWGQSRPWFLWLCVPFAITVWIAFTAPSLPDGAPKFWYALITYILAAGAVYTGIQTPITAILPNLTSDPTERNNANSFRMAGGQIGSFITSSFTIPLVGWFGVQFGGGDKTGFMIVTAIWGVVAIILLLFSFKNLNERNYHPELNKPIPLSDSLKAAKGNWPWIILVVAFVIYWVAQSTRNGVSTYYAQYVLENRNLTSIFNGVQVIGLLGTIAMPIIANKTKNKTLTMIIGLVIGGLGQALMPLAGHNVPLLVIFWTIGVLGAAIAIGMPFGMLADTVDYGEWKTGIHAAGFLTAVGSAFCIQVGSGFGAFLPLEIMGAAGYDANLEQQPQSALDAISFCFIWLPVIVYIIVGVIMCFYRKYEKMEPMIKAELAERHAKALAEAEQNA
ncbi:Na+/xyloside symporter related transporter [Bifidobacterium reuteri DSM 23975]|uniref:Na+/xyloside symporter related transporter n=1 Tax=Bifidobacterium reuteri DSM 23975 TaxID=1437610 RepID=A0A087CYJ0_9BIFI|nr:MFS transporter [Bifidobacterium reuteri]KFI88340.1 Na+/xyloside symporter related transporter [Bifidobacterium reuteri DSM 23975]